MNTAQSMEKISDVGAVAGKGIRKVAGIILRHMGGVIILIFMGTLVFLGALLRSTFKKDAENVQ